MESKRIPYIDLSKAAAILLVIIGHCYWLKSEAAVPYLYSFIYSFHMPLFFILSGMFIKEMDTKTAVSKYAKSYLLPYLVTCLICAVVIVATYVFHEQSGEIVPYLKKWIISTTYANPANRSNVLMGNMPIIGILWFLFAIFWSNLIYSVLKFKFKGLNLYIIMVCVASIGIVSLKVVRLPFSIQSGMCALLFVCLGDIMRRHDVLNKIKTLSPVAIFLLAFIWIASFLKGTFTLTYCNFPLGETSIIAAITGSFAFMMLCKQYCKYRDMGRISEWIGKNTLLILCVHHSIHCVMTEFGNPLECMTYHPLINFIIEALLQVVVTIALSKTLSLLPLVRTVYNIK